jgi:hypothetical protein
MALELIEILADKYGFDVDEALKHMTDLIRTDKPKPSFSANLVNIVVEATNAHGVRSSKRTDKIHEYIKNYIEEQNPSVRCVIEHPLLTELGEFSVDIAAFDRQTDELVMCVLFKALNSSISKNAKNYEHNKIGEAVKGKTGMPTSAKLVFIDVVPTKCPTFGKDECVEAWENHSPDKVKARSSKLINVANSGRLTPCIDDIYTISVEYAYSGKFLGGQRIVDETDIERFDTLIRSLAHHVD